MVHLDHAINIDPWSNGTATSDEAKSHHFGHHHLNLGNRHRDARPLRTPALALLLPGLAPTAQ